VPLQTSTALPLSANPVGPGLFCVGVGWGEEVVQWKTAWAQKLTFLSTSIANLTVETTRIRAYEDVDGVMYVKCQLKVTVAQNKKLLRVNGYSIDLTFTLFKSCILYFPFAIDLVCGSWVFSPPN
jgi:hypothetical protein